jgi:hypothetical protein
LYSVVFIAPDHGLLYFLLDGGEPPVSTVCMTLKSLLLLLLLLLLRERERERARETERETSTTIATAKRARVGHLGRELP